MGAIVQYADYGGPYPGSFIPALRRLGEEATKRGHEYRLVFSPVAKEATWLAQLSSFEVIFADPSSLSEVARTLLPGPVIVHSHFSSFDRPLARIKRTSTRIEKLIWHVHSVPSTATYARIRNSIRFGWIGRSADAIVCVAPEIQRSVRARFGRRTVLIPNGVDTSAFRQAGDCRSAARKQLGLPSGTSVFLHYGRDWELKGGDIFLRALADLPEAWALSVGSGPEAAADARALGISERFLQVAANSDVRDFLAAADVFVSSSRSEGMPYSVLEALASGRPTAMTPIAGNAYASRGAPGCYLATDMSPEALGKAMVCALHEPKRERISAWAKTHVDLQGWTDQIFALYGSAGPGGTSPHQPMRRVK